MIDEKNLDPVWIGTIRTGSINAIEKANWGDPSTAMGMALVKVSWWEGDQTYRDTVLPPEVKAGVAIEQGSSLGWAEWVGMNGAGMGMKVEGVGAVYKEQPGRNPLLTKAS